MKIPKRIRQNIKHPREKPPSFKLTSPEHFAFIENKAKERNVRGSKKAKSKAGEASRRPEKAKKSKVSTELDAGHFLLTRPVRCLIQPDPPEFTKSRPDPLTK
jgi:hypothetical protein